MTAPHVVILAVDGLRASALGAYGGAVETPAINRLASKSTLYDQFFADAPELTRVYESFWSSGTLSLADLIAERKGFAVLATDDPQGGGLSLADRFDAAAELTTPAASQPAGSIASTWLAGVFGEFADVLDAARSQPPTAQSPTAQSLFLWLHTRGMFGPWDAPTSLIESQLDEDDPPVAMTTAPAAGPVADDDPDAPFAASCRYAAQVSVLDACLGQFVAFIEERLAGEPWVLVLVGARGYALGEHGVIGADDRLYAESLHAPLIVRRSDGQGALRRVATPIGSSSLLDAIREGESVATPPLLSQRSLSGAAAVQRGEWRLIRPPTSDERQPQSRLYLKPSDRWEANDVASLMPETVEQLEALLSPASDLAPPGDNSYVPRV